MSRSSCVTHRAFERNHRVAGLETRSGAVEEGVERLVGQAQFSAHGSCGGFPLFPHVKFDRRSRCKAPLSRAPCHEASGVVVPAHAVKIWIAGSQSWRGQPSRSFSVALLALTEADTDAEDEDSDSHVSEVAFAETERSSGKRRTVILVAQTRVDPVDPTVVDEDLEVSSDQRASIHGAELLMLRVKPKSCYLPSHQSQQLPSHLRDSSTVSSGWRKWIWKLFSNSVRV